MAHPALGLAAPAHAQLDDPAARATPTRRRPGRVHDRCRGRRVDRRLCEGGRRAGPRPTRRSRPSARRTTASSSRPTGRRGGRDGRAGAAGRQRRLRARRRPTGRRRRASRAVGLPDYRRPEDLPTAACWWSAPSASGVQIAEEVHALGPAGHAGRGRARADAPHVPRPGHALVDGRGRPPRRALRRGPRPAARPQPAVLPARRLSRARRRSTSTRCTEPGVRLVGRLAGIRDGVAQFSGSLPNVCTLADLKLGRLLDTASTSGRRRRASTPSSRGARRRADARPRPRRRWTSTCAAARSARSSGPPVSGPTLLARRPGPRPQGPDPPRRRRRDGEPGPLRDRPAVPAAPQVHPHRRCGPGRRRHRRAPRRPPRRARPRRGSW